jgi:hypothetical protein
MERCLFYGLFPSFFSHNAANDVYWEQPALVERDRPLFRRYVPWIRRLAQAGWQPVTGARSSDASVLLERWGTRYLTALNLSATERLFTVSADPRILPQIAPIRLTIPGGATRVLDLRARRVVGP